MASLPLDTPFTRRELAVGRFVTAGLWMLLVALLALLAAWSFVPP